MYRTDKFLENKTPFFQLFSLVMLVILSVFFTFFIGVLIGLPFFGMNILDMLTNATNLENPDSIPLMKYFQVVNQMGMFIIPSFVFALLASRNVFSYLKFNKYPTPLMVIAALILAFTILPGINLLVEVNEAMVFPDWMSGIETWMRESEENAARLTEAFLKTDTIAGLFFNLVMIAVLAALGEELLFRGVLLRVLRKWFNNAHLAVWVSAILFSMMHLQFFGFLPRLALGVMFGYFLVWSGSLWLPILAHFINNAAAVLVYYFYDMDVIDTPVENFGALDNKLLLIVSILVSLALLFIVYYKGKEKTESPTL